MQHFAARLHAASSNNYYPARRSIAINIRQAQVADFPVLLSIWEQSVRATHDFLCEQDIQALIPVVRDQALPNLEVWVLCTGQGVPAGFMGLDDNNLEALFIAPGYFRRGYGKAMLAHARALKGALQVDVNEQNPDAVAFYLANGFEITGRSATDGQGQPFPLLHLGEAHTAGKGPA